MSGKKISIVFEENGSIAEVISFNVFLDGMTDHRRQEIDAMDPERQLQELSAAEYWALRCFQITMDALVQSGAVKEVKRR